MNDKEDLKSKAIKGSVWSLIETFSLQIVQFTVGVVLARILEPKDFGLIALTGIFTSISAAITDGGFEKTIIQKKNLSPIQISTIFYINILLGALMTILLILLSPYISAFFNAPELTPILQVVSLSIFLTSLSQTQQTLLLKELNFKKISQIQIITSIIGGITGLAMALTGFGVWALVYSALVPQIIKVIFFWIKSSWYPIFKFSYSSIKTLVPYGLNILVSSIFFFMIQQFNVFIVGRFYSKTELGLFNRGNRFPELVIGILQNVVLKMTLPIFAKIQDDTSHLLEVVKKTNKIVAFVSLPLLMLLFIKAEDITIFLFTEKWRGSIIFLQLFCIVRIFEPFITIHRELLLSQGLSALLLKIFTITSLFEISLILWLIHYGILYLVLATFISRVITYLTYTIINSKRLGIQWTQELGWFPPYILLTAGMGLIVLMLQYVMLHFTDTTLFWRIFMQLTIGIFSYGFLAYIFKVSEISYLNSFLKIASKKFLFKKSGAL